MEFSHVSVMLPEVLAALEPERGGVYVDCTAGGGGHSAEIAGRLPEGSRLICLDRDDEALGACRLRLADFGDRVALIKANFRNLDAALDLCGADRIDGILWDLGVSSHQLDDGERGFSYAKDAPLDMRMDQSASLTARDVVNTYSEDELRRIIRDWGEERFASRIASFGKRSRKARSAICVLPSGRVQGWYSAFMLPYSCPRYCSSSSSRSGSP